MFDVKKKKVIPFETSNKLTAAELNRFLLTSILKIPTYYSPKLFSRLMLDSNKDLTKTFQYLQYLIKTSITSSCLSKHQQ